MACHTEAEWKQIKMVQEQVNVKFSQDTGEVMWRQVKAKVQVQSNEPQITSISENCFENIIIITKLIMTLKTSTLKTCFSLTKFLKFFQIKKRSFSWSILCYVMLCFGKFKISCVHSCWFDSFNLELKPQKCFQIHNPDNRQLIIIKLVSAFTLHFAHCFCLLLAQGNW